MSKEIITIGDIEIEKHKFNRYKNQLFLNDVDIDNILISKKNSSSKNYYKYCICDMDDYSIKPFTIILSKSSVYVKSYDGRTKWMYFLIEDEEL